MQMEGEDPALSMFWPNLVETYPSVTVGSLKFRTGDWVVLRTEEGALTTTPSRTPAVPSGLWFGQVQALVVHHSWRTQNGRLQRVAAPLVQARWYDSAQAPGGPFDGELQCPVLPTSADRVLMFDSIFKILPIRFTVLPHPLHSDRQVAVARNWHVLSAVGAPLPWPKLMFYPEVAVPR